MSQIMTIRRFGLLIIVGLALVAGCGTPNDVANFDSDAGTHVSDWKLSRHAAASVADSNGCTECHGSDFAGGLSGVACADCHVSGSPVVMTNCTSCHASPPNGTVAPNRSNSHPVHNALPNVAKVCDSCHMGAGSGTVKNNNGVVDVVFLGAYKAKSGAAVLNPDGTCSNVSCHGGKTTPPWVLGVIDVNTQCTACHASGTSQFNSYNSGQHNYHVATRGISCTACHDTAKLAAKHFSSLNTSAMEGPASATLNSSLNYNGATCTLTCHGTRTW